jgi:very-short-patch-repair endonuclease
MSSHKSKLEQKFENLLVELGIKFINQHPLNGYLYDFYIPKHNLLIEVDGDWFHCNPDVHPEAIHEIQKFVKENDERKNLIAKENNIPLLRFWEKDINDSIDLVKSKLSEYL